MKIFETIQAWDWLSFKSNIFVEIWKDKVENIRELATKTFHRRCEVQFLVSTPEHLKFMLLFSTFLLWLHEANKRKSSFKLKEFSTHEKTVPFAFYFVSQKEFQTSMWFVLTELVVKCGKKTEQLQFITKEIRMKQVAAIIKLFGANPQELVLAPNSFWRKVLRMRKF